MATTTTTTAAPTTTTTTAAPTTTTTRAPRATVNSDSGTGSRGYDGISIHDYHAPWWLQ